MYATRQTYDYDRDREPSYAEETPKKVPQRGIFYKKPKANPDKYRQTYDYEGSSGQSQDLRQGLDGLLKLGEYVKAQIEELEGSAVKVVATGSNPRTRKLQGERIFEDDESDHATNDGGIDSEIAKKVNALLRSQGEWERQRKMIQEKLEKIEKNMEKQTKEEQGSVNPMATPKNDALKNLPWNQQTKEPPGLFPDFRTPQEKPAKLELTGKRASDPETLQTKKQVVPDQIPAKGGNLLETMAKGKGKDPSQKVQLPVSPVGSLQLHSPISTPANQQTKTLSLDPYQAALKLKRSQTEISEISKKSEVVKAGKEGFMNALKYALHALEKGDGDVEEVRHHIDSEHRLAFGIGKDPTTNKRVPGKVIMKLLSKETILFEEALSAEQLEFIFGMLHVTEVLPNHLPSSSFIQISYFLQHVLSKFVHLSKDEDAPKAIIQRSPKSLLTEELRTLFLGEEHTITLIHLQECVFRMILRKVEVEEEDQKEGLCADIFFNEFVKSSFFEVKEVSNTPELLEKLTKNQKLSNSDATQLKSTVSTAKNTLILQPNLEKQTKIASMLLNLGKYLEDHLRVLHPSIESLDNCQFLFVLKLVDWKQERFTIYEVVEENEFESGFKIRARNSFLSHSNYCAKDVHDTAFFNCKPSHVREIFAVEYKNLEASERRMIWHSFIERANLEVIEAGKGIDIGELLGEERCTEQEAMFKKTLTIHKVDIPIFKQFFVGDQYKLPVTMQLIAYKGVINGVVIRAYDPFINSDSSGLLLLPDNTFESGKEIKKKRAIGIEDYRRKFGLIGFLENSGWDRLFKSLVKVRPDNVPSIKPFALTTSFKTKVVPLEHFFNIHQFIGGITVSFA